MKDTSVIPPLPPLSVLTFYRRNLARTLPVGGAITISVFLIAAVVTLLNSVDSSIVTNYGAVRSFAVLTTQFERDVPDFDLNKVEANPHLGRTVVAVPYPRTLKTVFGEMPAPIYGVDAPDMMPLLKATRNHISQGRLPAVNEPEIVVSRLWANNFGAKVGDWLEAGSGRIPTLAERQKLVGILEGGENLALADKSYLLGVLPEAVIRPAYLLIPKKPTQMEAMSQPIAAMLDNPKKQGWDPTQTRYIKFYNFERSVAEFREGLGFLYRFLAIADFLVIGAVAMLSGFLANIYFEQRLPEFGLLSALGFRRERLARRLSLETGLLVIAGWLAGVLLVWAIFGLLETYYMTPRGLVLARMDGFALLYTLPTPILVGFASLATVLYRLYRLDSIQIMERR